MTRMKDTDEEWNAEWSAEGSAENLARYQNDGQDLTPAIHQGQRIADLRDLCELSVDELAAKSGLKSNDLLAIEAGLQALQPAQAVRLAKSLGVHYSDLWFNRSE